MAIQQNVTLNTQRAFVFLKEMAITFDRPPDPPPGSMQHDLMSRLGAAHLSIRSWRISPIWENSGNTPTRRLMLNFACREFSEPIPKDFDFPYEAVPEPSFIGPKAITLGSGVRLGADLIDKLAEHGNHQLYVWGFADYDDVFENTARHRTEFCFRVEVTGSNSDGFPMLAFPLHDKHNGADHECYRQPAPYVEPQKA